MTNLDWALRYIARGWAVVAVYPMRQDGTCACSPEGCAAPGKHPIGGPKASIRDTMAARAMWSNHPAAGVGLNMRASGLVAVDDDTTRKGGESAAVVLDLRPTLTLRTGGGGDTYVYAREDNERFPATAGENIDLRDDAFIVVEPSPHVSGGKYVWDDLSVTPAPCPPGVPRKIEDRREATPVGEFDGQSHPGALAEVNRLCSELAATGEGGRGNKAVAVGRLCGGHVASGAVSAELTWAKIEEAVLACDPEGRTDTLSRARSGFDSGQRDPLEAPPYTRHSEPVAPQKPARRGRRSTAADVGDTDWLWDRRIPIGEISVLDGDPGVGKTTILCDLAARVSNGRGFPGGDREFSSGGVVMCFIEDDLIKTINPRLVAAGADMSKILTFEAADVLTMPSCLPVLEEAVRDVGARLVIIDPLLGHMDDGVDSHKDAAMRANLLNPLVASARANGYALMVNRHVAKAAAGQQGGKAVHAGMGSLAITALARYVTLAIKYPSSDSDADDDRLLLATAKANLSREPGTLVYRIGTRPVPGVRDSVPFINWSSEQSEFKNADAVLAATRAAMTEGADGGATKAQLTLAMVRAMQAACPDGVGSERARIIVRALGGLADRQAQKALREAGIEPHKRGDGAWVYGHEAV